MLAATLAAPAALLAKPAPASPPPVTGWHVTTQTCTHTHVTTFSTRSAVLFAGWSSHIHLIRGHWAEACSSVSPSTGTLLVIGTTVKAAASTAVASARAIALLGPCDLKREVSAMAASPRYVYGLVTLRSRLLTICGLLFQSREITWRVIAFIRRMRTPMGGAESGVVKAVETRSELAIICHMRG